MRTPKSASSRHFPIYSLSKNIQEVEQRSDPHPAKFASTPLRAKTSSSTIPPRKGEGISAIDLKGFLL